VWDCHAPSEAPSLAAAASAAAAAAAAVGKVGPQLCMVLRRGSGGLDSDAAPSQAVVAKLLPWRVRLSALQCMEQSTANHGVYGSGVR
jgi:hypothetical protein